MYLKGSGYMGFDGSLSFDTKIDEKGISQGFSKVGSIAKTGMAVIGGTITALTGVAAAAVGASVKAFAEYEQLVGGVDTLFKSSSKQVQAYADNAYKTAGLSANQYMSTVTSFSASLLQSLGGDTEKAAKYADGAITDMADNANKMGTGMDMIQNAYQGFAKQNYTMLDNLKLGYGGTKTEMERLLSDASKISGIKYDISSFSDVTQAIHTMQTEMGITGTTALEASETVSGSASAMKAAWENLMAGLGNKDANLDKMIANLVESVKTFATNILPIIEQALLGIGSLITTLLPQIFAELPNILNTIIPELFSAGIGMTNAILTGLTENSGVIMDGILQLLGTLLTGLATTLPMLLQLGINLILNLANGLTQSMPTVMPLIIDFLLGMVQTIIDNLPMIIEAGIQLMVALAIGLIEALPQIIEKLPQIITGIIDALIGAIPLLIGAGVKLLVALVTNLPAILLGIGKALIQIIAHIFGFFADAGSKMADIGENLIKGLWNGIKDTGKWLEDKIAGFFGGVVDGIKDFFGIHSPSTLMADEVGLFAGMGVGVGFEKSMGKVKKQMTSSIAGVVKDMQKNVAMDATVAGMTKIVYDNEIEKDTNTRNPSTDFKGAIDNAFSNAKVILDKREVGRVLVVRGA